MNKPIDSDNISIVTSSTTVSVSNPSARQQEEDHDRLYPSPRRSASLSFESMATSRRSSSLLVPPSLGNTSTSSNANISFRGRFGEETNSLVETLQPPTTGTSPPSRFASIHQRQQRASLVTENSITEKRGRGSNYPAPPPLDSDIRNFGSKEASRTSLSSSNNNTSSNDEAAKGEEKKEREKVSLLRQQLTAHHEASRKKNVGGEPDARPGLLVPTTTNFSPDGGDSPNSVLLTPNKNHQHLQQQQQNKQAAATQNMVGVGGTTGSSRSSVQHASSAGASHYSLYQSSLSSSLSSSCTTRSPSLSPNEEGEKKRTIYQQLKSEANLVLRNKLREQDDHNYDSNGNISSSTTTVYCSQDMEVPTHCRSETFWKHEQILEPTARAEMYASSSFNSKSNDKIRTVSSPSILMAPPPTRLEATPTTSTAASTRSGIFRNQNGGGGDGSSISRSHHSLGQTKTTATTLSTSASGGDDDIAPLHRRAYSSPIVNPNSMQSQSMDVDDEKDVKDDISKQDDPAILVVDRMPISVATLQRDTETEDDNDSKSLDLQVLEDEDVNRSYPSIADRSYESSNMIYHNSYDTQLSTKESFSGNIPKDAKDSLEKQAHHLLHSTTHVPPSFRVVGGRRNTMPGAIDCSKKFDGSSNTSFPYLDGFDEDASIMTTVPLPTTLTRDRARQLSLPGAQFIRGILAAQTSVDLLSRQRTASTMAETNSTSHYTSGDDADNTTLQTDSNHQPSVLSPPGATSIVGPNQPSQEQQPPPNNQDILLEASLVNDGDDLMGTVVYDAQKLDRRIPLWALITLGFLFILTLTLSISLPLTIGRKKVFVGTTSPMPSLAPSMPPSTTREMIVTNYIRDVFSAATSSAHTNTTATDDIVDDPKIQRAIEWMALEDPLHLDPMLHDNFLQRFLLALFYFQTGPWRTCNPNFADDTIDNDDNNSTTCTFDDFQRQADSSVIFVPLEDQTRWLSSAHECDWVGITCLFGNRREVNFMALTAFGASGTLPTELVLMPSLYFLTLNYNNFVGTIPLEYATGWKQPFQKLDLNGNFLTGTIPQELLNVTSMLHLNLGQNMFTGTIDSAIGQLSQLRSLFVFDNGFDGPIPTEIGKLDKLAHTRWNSNYFDGTIPSDVAQLELLAEIWLSNNTLTGTIPETWATRKLTDLRLGGNRLEGTIPDDIFLQSRLQRLDVSGNGFSGRIDSRLSSLSEMQQLRLSQNRFTGTIPSGLGELSDVTLMWFHENKLTGTMPSEICDNTGPGRIRFLSTDCRPVDDDRNQTKVAVECDNQCCSRCCGPPTYTPDGFVDKARSDCVDNYICAPIAELNDCLASGDVKACLERLLEDLKSDNKNALQR